MTTQTDEIARLTHERDAARAEAHEQARLLGMSAERELKLMAEVERLRETNEAIKRITKQWRIDAERYRWLRNFQNLAITREVLGEYDTLDAAIDAAMRGGK